MYNLHQQCFISKRDALFKNISLYLPIHVYGKARRRSCLLMALCKERIQGKKIKPGLIQ